MLRKKKPYRRIYGAVGSCLCTAFWIAAAVQFALTGRDVLIPLIAAVIFSVCAFFEVKGGMKYGFFDPFYPAARKPSEIKQK